MAKYFLTNKGVDDLESIWQCTIETWYEQQSDLYYSQIISTCNQIADDTSILDREYTEIHQGLYSRRFCKHLIFCKITTDNNIEIVRILHERMEIAPNYR